MNRYELQALRRLLNFSRPEAAQFVASSDSRPNGVSDRAWRQWENGDYPVPADVATGIRQLAQWRSRTIAEIEVRIMLLRPGEHIGVVWYETPGEWASLAEHLPVLWRPYQAVVAHLIGEYGNQVRLVGFDALRYADWLGEREDSQGMRSQWADSMTA